MTEALARGFLVAWVAWSAVPVGSLVLAMIHVVTGGRWGVALGPVLRPALALMPLAALAFLGIWFGLAAIYPWASQTGLVKPNVATFYLNPPLFALRAAVALAGWSALAVLCLTGRCGRLAAGLGLAFYGLTISLVAVDWILSVEPGVSSSAFASGIALHQILAALAWAGVAGVPGRAGRDATDLAGLMLATLLGVLYMSLMSFIVAWYGDLPPKALWYLKRGAGAWDVVLLAILLVGGVLPFAMLLFSPVRRSAAALRAVGLLVLLGVAGHLAWYILPAYGDAAGAAAAFVVPALIALTLLSVLWLRIIDRPRARPAHA